MSATSLMLFIFIWCFVWCHCCPNIHIMPILRKTEVLETWICRVTWDVPLKTGQEPLLQRFIGAMVHEKQTGDHTHAYNIHTKYTGSIFCMTKKTNWIFLTWKVTETESIVSSRPCHSPHQHQTVTASTKAPKQNWQGHWCARVSTVKQKQWWAWKHNEYTTSKEKPISKRKEMLFW